MTVERNEQPADRLGELANEALELIAASPDGDAVRVIVYLEDGERCMTALAGWESDVDAIAAMVAHLAALMKANGKDLVVLPLQDPRGS
jgi:hypothetical protein